MRTVCTGILAFLLSAPAWAAQSLTLAEDGKPRAVIVLPDSASAAAREGAAILGDHLFEISGARFKTLRESDLGAVVVKDGRLEGLEGAVVLVGEGRLAGLLGATSKDLGPGGVLLRTYPNALVLLGPDSRTPTDPNGTRYAVTLFLEEALGCRYLWPGEEGKIVPRRKTVEVPALDRTYTPKIRQRKIRMATGYGKRKDKGVKLLHATEADYMRLRAAAMATRSRDGGWAGWHRLGGSLRLAGGHAFGDMWEKYKDTHPEWFAVQPDGTRDQRRSPDRSRLCVSNVELIEEIARIKIEQLNRSGVKSVSIGPNDGGQTKFCVCPECRKLDPPEGRKVGNGVSLTDRYVHFWNGVAERVAKVHPDAWLTADAYSIYAAPPVREKLHPNLAIRFVGLTYLDEKERLQDRKDWDEWSRAVEKIYYRPNVLLAGRRQGTPAVYIHKFAEDFTSMAEGSLIGTDFDSVCHNWATQGLNYYVAAKLHWNPGLDVDELLDDYCRAGFGSGAEDVKKYFLHVERLTDRIAAGKLRIWEPYTPEVIQELRGYLDAAAAATREEPDARRRVGFLKIGLDYTDAYVAFFHINREFQDAGGGRLSPELKQRMREALDRNWLVSRNVFFKRHLAVNVATVAWGSWAYFVRFGWSSPSPEILKQAQTGSKK